MQIFMLALFNDFLRFDKFGLRASLCDSASSCAELKNFDVTVYSIPCVFGVLKFVVLEQIIFHWTKVAHCVSMWCV